MTSRCGRDLRKAANQVSKPARIVFSSECCLGSSDDEAGDSWRQPDSTASWPAPPQHRTTGLVGRELRCCQQGSTEVHRKCWSATASHSYRAPLGMFKSSTKVTHYTVTEVREGDVTPRVAHPACTQLSLISAWALVAPLRWAKGRRDYWTFPWCPRFDVSLYACALNRFLSFSPLLYRYLLFFLPFFLSIVQRLKKKVFFFFKGNNKWFVVAYVHFLQEADSLIQRIAKFMVTWNLSLRKRSTANLARCSKYSRLRV